MSSFICSPKHFNIVEANLSVLFVDANGSGRNPLNTYQFEKFKDFDRNEPVPFIKLMMTTLRNISAEAVTRQYAHHSTDVEKEIAEQVDILKIRDPRHAERINHPALSNALACINYQIEIDYITKKRELTDVEKDAMLFLETVINEVNRMIVRSLPQWEAAPWGY